jgi:hypothetical protein
MNGYTCTLMNVLLLHVDCISDRPVVLIVRTCLKSSGWVSLEMLGIFSADLIFRLEYRTSARGVKRGRLVWVLVFAKKQRLDHMKLRSIVCGVGCGCELFMVRLSVHMLLGSE